MKKTVGFIFTLILIVMFSSVASVKAETYITGVKDYADQYTKKKEKKAKKDKKKTKKNKKKGFGTIKVVSASSLFTNKVDDLSKFDYQNSVISVMRPNNGYVERLQFLDKFVNGEEHSGLLDVVYGEKVASFVDIDFGNYSFGFIDNKNLSYVYIGGLRNDSTFEIDRDLILKKLSNVGIQMSFSKDLIADLIKNSKSYKIKIGNASWTIKRGMSESIELVRDIKPIVVHRRDSYKAVLAGRLNITPSFYNHLLTFLDKTAILEDTEGSVSADIGDGDLSDSTTVGEGIIQRFIYADKRKEGRTELRIGGFVKPETAVDDLTKILKEYCDVDFNEFDTSRVNKIVENGIINWDEVVYEKKYGNNSINISIVYSDERGYAYTIRVTVHND